jgi:hypothetical protein
MSIHIYASVIWKKNQYQNQYDMLKSWYKHNTSLAFRKHKTKIVLYKSPTTFQGSSSPK